MHLKRGRLAIVGTLITAVIFSLVTPLISEYLPQISQSATVQAAGWKWSKPDAVSFCQPGTTPASSANQKSALCTQFISKYNTAGDLQNFGDPVFQKSNVQLSDAKLYESELTWDVASKQLFCAAMGSSSKYYKSTEDANNTAQCKSVSAAASNFYIDRHNAIVSAIGLDSRSKITITCKIDNGSLAVAAPGVPALGEAARKVDIFEVSALYDQLIVKARQAGFDHNSVDLVAGKSYSKSDLAECLSYHYYLRSAAYSQSHIALVQTARLLLVPEPKCGTDGVSENPLYICENGEAKLTEEYLADYSKYVDAFKQAFLDGHWGEGFKSVWEGIKQNNYLSMGMRAYFNTENKSGDDYLDTYENSLEDTLKGIWAFSEIGALMQLITDQGSSAGVNYANSKFVITNPAELEKIVSDSSVSEGDVKAYMLKGDEGQPSGIKSDKMLETIQANGIFLKGPVADKLNKILAASRGISARCGVDPGGQVTRIARILGFTICTLVVTMQGWSVELVKFSVGMLGSTANVSAFRSEYTFLPPELTGNMQGLFTDTSNDLAQVLQTLSQSILTLINGALLFFFLLIALSSIFQIEVKQFNIRQLLPKLIIGFILAQFAVLGIRASLEVVDRLSAEILIGDISQTQNGFTRAYEKSLLVMSGGDAPLTSNGQANGKDVDYFKIFQQLILNIALMAAAVMIFILAFLFVIRSVVFIFLTPIAPLAFFSAGLPFLDEVWKRWSKLFTSWLFMPLISMFWIWLGFKWLSALSSVFFAPVEVGGSGGLLSTDLLQQVLVYAFALTCIYFAMKTPFSMAGEAKDLLNKWNSTGKKGWGLASENAIDRGKIAFNTSLVGRGVKKYTRMGDFRKQALKEAQSTGNNMYRAVKNEKKQNNIAQKGAERRAYLQKTYANDPQLATILQHHDSVVAASLDQSQYGLVSNLFNQAYLKTRGITRQQRLQELTQKHAEKKALADQSQVYLDQANASIIPPAGAGPTTNPASGPSQGGPGGSYGNPSSSGGPSSGSGGGASNSGGRGGSSGPSGGATSGPPPPRVSAASAASASFNSGARIEKNSSSIEISGGFGGTKVTFNNRAGLDTSKIGTVVFYAGGKKVGKDIKSPQIPVSVSLGGVPSSGKVIYDVVVYDTSGRSVLGHYQKEG